MPRGGPRKPGPGKKIGRPLDPNKKQPYTAKLRPDHIKWLRDQRNASAELEAALDKHIKEKAWEE